jgi:flagellar biosynthetic protein FlhB
MAEEASDKDQRTEDPTGKRIDEARREGKLPVSQEVRSWCMITMGMFVIMIMGPRIAQDMMEALPKFFAIPDQLQAAEGGVRKALSDTFWHMFPNLATATAMFVFAALIGTIAQTGWFFSGTLASPKWNRLSLIGGWKKLFSVQSLIETFKGTLKISIVGFVMYKILAPLVDKAELMVGMEPALQSKMILDVTVKLMFIAVLFLTFYAAFDLFYQRHRYNESLKMTKHEVKDEHKQSEGDPIARNRLRQIRMDRARRRMMAMIPNADVITNPTHYAVALEYKIDKMHAPRVIGKGQDMIALKIREIAEANDVPVVENPPLARALHASCDIDQEVPVEHYKAVAEVISYVYRLKNKTVKR